ncbi:MAG: GIY-YIG nuclease family protein [Gemmatimonas sp.]
MCRSTDAINTMNWFCCTWAFHHNVRPRTARRASRGHLHKRLRNHYRGNASVSTLRLTLGMLLGQSLGISLRRTGRTARRTFGDGESVLSHWMDTNNVVCWQSNAGREGEAGKDRLTGKLRKLFLAQLILRHAGSR